MCVTHSVSQWTRKSQYQKQFKAATKVRRLDDAHLHVGGKDIWVSKLLHTAIRHSLLDITVHLVL